MTEETNKVELSTNGELIDANDETNSNTDGSDANDNIDTEYTLSLIHISEPTRPY